MSTPRLPAVVAAQQGKAFYRWKTALKIISIVLAVILLLSVSMFVAAYVATEMRSFPIFINNKGGITLCESADFANPTGKLNATVPEEMTNISFRDLPSGIDSPDWVGSHCGNGFIAYTFYLKGTVEGTQTLTERVNITLKSKNAEAAIRVRFYRNGIETTYAKVAGSGLPEYGTTPFKDEDTVFENQCSLAEGEIIRYTIVIWLEGDDPECVDDIKGGYVGFNMEFEADPE